MVPMLLKAGHEVVDGCLWRICTKARRLVITGDG